MAKQSGSWTEGITAGLLGAGGVALWFFAVDSMAGRPLYTPGLLGGALLNVLGRGVNHSTLYNAAVYSVLHVAVFLLIGVMASRIVEVSKRIPQVLAGLLLFFVVFEVGFYGVAALMSQYSLVGSLAWYQIGAANLFSAVLMGGYLWRRHPELGPAMEASLDGSV